MRRPGLQTTVQDLGRPGYGRYGVPFSGAMDTWSLRLGNLLLDNQPDAAALEMTLVGPELEALAPLVYAYTGADFNLTVAGRPVRPGRTLQLREGDVLRFGAARAGARAYLCVEGGWDVAPVLGSRATAVTAGLGGIDGRPVLGSDILRALPSRWASDAYTPRKLRRSLLWEYSGTCTLRVVEGPQASGMPDAVEMLLASSWRVSERASRVGVRLDGPTLQSYAGSFETEGVPPGAVQVPPDGTPILLLADRQTTGGYPKPAVLASVDLPLAGQLRPGDEISFELVTVDQAVELLHDREAELETGVYEYERGDGGSSLVELVRALEQSQVEELRLQKGSFSFHWRRAERR